VRHTADDATLAALRIEQRDRMMKRKGKSLMIETLIIAHAPERFQASLIPVRVKNRRSAKRTAGPRQRNCDKTIR